ncbi:MAG: PAS domain S-box protein [Syntrophorhabdaceae bacterium]|nr:PAS domain S-box protein [Syntrophorhabdaceae bacterium]MDD4194987.1 PAS domain S-box protein [Syntrophorhabdaceae bacterium]
MELASLLKTHRDEIIKEWMAKIPTLSERYSRLPTEEIRRTVTLATDANFAFLIENDRSKMDIFIEMLTAMRLAIGFALAEVQSAFELYRTVTVPIFLKELDPPVVLPVIEKLNSCMSYTIHRFSEHFESVHQKMIRDHALELEVTVEKRTCELAESEAKYRMLIEDINDGYFVSRNGRVIFANKAFCDMHGYTLEEVISRRYMDFVAPESRGDLAKIYEERITTGHAPEQYIYMGLRKDGGKFYTENKVKSVAYEGKEAVAGICRDVTERVELEKHRLKLVELENERKTIALTTLRQLMVTLSHYLLNANTVIGGMARRSMRASSETARSAALDTIRKQAAKTENIISALKRVSEIRTTEYTKESQILMMDLTKEIEEALAAPEKKEAL